MVYVPHLVCVGFPILFLLIPCDSYNFHNSLPLCLISYPVFAIHGIKKIIICVTLSPFWIVRILKGAKPPGFLYRFDDAMLVYSFTGFLIIGFFLQKRVD